jgi:hypothetical protein
MGMRWQQWDLLPTEYLGKFRLYPVHPAGMR